MTCPRSRRRVAEIAPLATSRQVRLRSGELSTSLPLPRDEFFDEIASLAAEPAPAPPAEFPFVLSAGERRSYTANTIIRNPDWRRKDRDGALRIHPADAARLGLADGDRARLTTARGSATVAVELSDRMQPGHVSLPNGQGTYFPQAADASFAPNELTSVGDRDAFAGTPWHKYVPSRIERAAA